MILQCKLQFRNTSRIIGMSDAIMLFCPLLDCLILCRIGVVGEKCGLIVLDLVNSQSIMYIVSQLYHFLRFDSTVVINVLISISSPKLSNQVFLISKDRVCEHASGLTTTPKAELFCNCKRRKFTDQNKVKICKLDKQNFKFSGQRIGCPSPN